MKLCPNTTADTGAGRNFRTPAKSEQGYAMKIERMNLVEIWHKRRKRDRGGSITQGDEGGLRRRRGTAASERPTGQIQMSEVSEKAGDGIAAGIGDGGVECVGEYGADEGGDEGGVES